jgi:hypothetical protein
MRIPLVLALSLAATAAGVAAAQGDKAKVAKPPPPMAFKPAELDLAPGETYPVELFVPSPTGKALQGTLKYEPAAGVTVNVDRRWTGKMPPWGVKTYPTVTLGKGAAPGVLRVRALLEQGGEADLKVHVVEPQLEVIPGFRRLTVRVTNPFRARRLHGRIEAANPDRFLQNVRSREFNVQPGQSQEVVFPLPGAAPVEDELYEFTLTVETYQGFRTQKKYPLEFPTRPPDAPVDP